MSEKEPQVQTALRLPESLLARVDKLAESMTQPGMRVTRADVLRIAAHRGVDQLEELQTHLDAGYKRDPERKKAR